MTRNLHGADQNRGMKFALRSIFPHEETAMTRLTDSIQPSRRRSPSLPVEGRRGARDEPGAMH